MIVTGADGYKVAFAIAEFDFLARNGLRLSFVRVRVRVTRFRVAPREGCAVIPEAGACSTWRGAPCAGAAGGHPGRRVGSSADQGFHQCCSTPPTVLRPVPLQPSAP